MNRKIILSPRADEEWQQVLDYLQAEFGQKAVDNCIDEVVHFANSIAVNPKLFREINRKKIRKAVVRNGKKIS